MQWLLRYRDLVLPVGIVACLFVILVPLPPLLMDVLLAANITVGMIVLLTTVYVSTPLEFSIFPSLLLATTLVRLVLNVATTRLILTGAESDQMSAAGGVIRSFGEFVSGDSVEVGLILFGIIVLIQFIVITKGSTRISEVAARFALDGMPGRQMAIDADVNAGLIDDHEAQRRRREIASQADFYGAMDGASKFVRGDAIAGLVIMAINIVGGLYIGVVRIGMPIGDAAELFTKLTIGDGLVSQVPALLISLAAGLLVTRSTVSSNLPQEFIGQLFGNPRALMVAGVFMVIMILTNLPTMPLATLGFGCVGLAVVMNRQAARDEAETADKESAEQAANAKPVKRVEDFLAVDPMEFSIGLGLLPLADPARGGDLMERISGIRNSVAGDIGIILPKVRVRDEAALGDHEYEIRIAGSPVARAAVLPQHWLAIDQGTTTGPLEGLPDRAPGSNRPAFWIDPSQREQAAIYGYQCVAPSAVLAGHLREVVGRYADELLTRDATKHLIDELRQVSPAVVDELIPGLLKLADVQQVLQLLLREDVPIRQLGIIMETLGDHAAHTQDPFALVESVRQRLARTISCRYRDADNRLWVVTLDPLLEDRIASAIDVSAPSWGAPGFSLRLNPETVELACERIEKTVKRLIDSGRPPVLLTSPRVRPNLRQLTSAAMPQLRILSLQEITPDTHIESLGIVGDV